MKRYLVFGFDESVGFSDGRNYGWNALKGEFHSGEEARDEVIKHYYDWSLDGQNPRWHSFQIVDSHTGTIIADESQWLSDAQFKVVRDDHRKARVTAKVAAIVSEGYCSWNNYMTLKSNLKASSQDDFLEQLKDYNEKAFFRICREHALKSSTCLAQ